MYSADFFIFSNNTKINQAYFTKIEVTSGLDQWGQYSKTELFFGLKNANSSDFSFFAKTYIGSDSNNKLVFGQVFHSPITGTQNNGQKNWMGDTQLLSTSFPSLYTYKESLTTQEQSSFGFYHFAGFMSGSMFPSSGNSKSFLGAEQLFGGIRNASVISFFNDNVSITASPSTQFVAASLEGYTNDQQQTRQVRWGLNGNIDGIPSDYSSEWMFRCNPSNSVNQAMRNWGKDLRGKYNKGDHEAAHDRDPTLQTVGASSDNGAGDYYLSFPMTNPNNQSQTLHNYQDYYLALKQESLDKQIPYHWAELDSWWYYHGSSGPWGLSNGLLNWTARPDIFPNGLQYIKDKTDWPFQLHNRYFAPNTVYASNPLEPIGPTDYKGKTFPFVFSKQTGNGVPQTGEFWEYFFEIKQGSTGGVSYIQDWISFVFDQVEELTSNATFGLEWLTGMGRGAEVNGWSIQLCMSYPRAILASVVNPSFTQARASNDYQPQSLDKDYYQYRIGDSSLFAESLGLSPAKDNFWTSTVPQLVPHYDPISTTRETRVRLESVVATMSNSIVAIGDALGYVVRDIVMLSCNDDGLLLRPDQAATPIDSWFSYKAFDQYQNYTPKQTPRPTIVDPVLHFTFSTLNKDSPFQQLQYFYFLSINNGEHAFKSIQFNDLLQSSGQYSKSNALPSPIQFFAWEFNSSANPSTMKTVSPSQDLVLNTNSGELNFEYFTLVPVYKWMVDLLVTPSTSSFPIFLGETGKWISASKQRITSVSFSAENGMKLFVKGAIGEIVSMSFARVIATSLSLVENSGSRMSCKIGPDQTAVFYFLSNTQFGCN